MPKTFVMSLRAALTALLLAHAGVASALSPDAVLADLRRLQGEKKLAECVTLGESEAPNLPEWTIIWHIVAECYAADRKPCEAEASVARFIAAPGGSSAERVAQAKALSWETHATCELAKAGQACTTVYDLGDWQGCVELCKAADNAWLPRPRPQMLARCYLRQGQCDDATTELGARPETGLDPEDQALLAKCARHAAPETVRPSPGEPKRAGSTAAWIVMGVGAVACGVGLAFLAVAEGQSSDVLALPFGPDYEARYDVLRRSFDAHVTVGYLTAGAGVVAIGTGIVMLLGADGRDPAAVPHSAPPSVVPSLLPGGAGVSATLSF